MKKADPAVTTAFAVMILTALHAAQGARYYVSPDGNDDWSGRAAARSGDDGPFRTLKKATAVAGPGDTCYIRGGVYREILRPARSGTAAEPLTFTVYRDERAVISGADLLDGWKREPGGRWSAPLPRDLKDGNQLFAGHRVLTEARWPNNTGGLLEGHVRARVEAGTENTITDPNIPGGNDDWKGALLWCAGGSEWICWTARVTAWNPESHTLTFDRKKAKGWYRPKKGNPYVLMGVRKALDAPGEWWLDRENGRVYLLPPAGTEPAAMAVAAKQRLHAVDLSGRSHVRVSNIRFRAAGMLTDNKSSHLLLEGLTGRYVGHSYEKDLGGRSGVLIHGNHITVRNCEFAKCSGSVVDMRGTDNRLINCYVHHGNYGAKWRGTMAIRGRRHVVAWNTVRHSGRDLVNIHGLSESLIEHNDFSEAGWLTSDLGMTYGHNTDFGNTVIRYNLVHDNHAPHCAMGIYFDHLSHNAIVHHNVVWNVGMDPIRINNPSYHNIVANNTCWKTGRVSTFDHSRRNDLFGCRYANNIFNEKLRLPDHVIVQNNLVTTNPRLRNPSGGDFTPAENAKAVNAGTPIPGITPAGEATPDIGAVPRGRTPWDAGHDFSRPPKTPVLRRPDIAGMNLLQNACFERETLEHWRKTGAANAKLTPGNGWGNNFGTGKPEPTGTSKRELRLGGRRDGVEQEIPVKPETTYELSAWMKVAGKNESVNIGVKGFDGPAVSAAVTARRWTRKIVTFTTGTTATAAVVFLEKTTPGNGNAWCDNTAVKYVISKKQSR